MEPALPPGVTTPHHDPRPDPDAQRRARADIEAIWARFRDKVMGQVDVLETASTALGKAELETVLRVEAARCAQALAGSLGTFGYSEASRLARQIERLLEGGEPLGPQESQALADLVQALRRETEAQKARDRAESPPAAAAAPSAPPLLSRLLVVDPDAARARRIVAGARGLGMKALAAADLSVARELALLRPPHVAVVSLDAPGGPAGPLALVADLTALDPPVSVLLLAERDDLADRVEAARVGAAAVLVAPAPADRVLDQVEVLLEARRVAAPTVLAVDDEPLVLETLADLLALEGIRVVPLAHPHLFWEALEETRPDLVLMDIGLPDVDGLELCRVVRASARWADLPVVFLIGQKDAETVDRVYAAGGDDFVTKPVVVAELVTRIANRLARVRHHRRAAERDGLTGLPTRQGSEPALERLLQLADRHGTRVSLAAVDLDRLAEVNEREGPAAGDRALMRVAEVLTRAFRGNDVVARWGGDELVVGMYGMPRADGVRRLRRALEDARTSARAAFSAGVAEFPADGADLYALWRAATRACRAAKDAGGGRVFGGGVAGLLDPASTIDVAVVEAEESLAVPLLDALAASGYRAQWIADGEAAVERLTGDPPELTARVVLLAARLPDVDGLAVLERLKAGRVLEGTRIVLLTGHENDSDAARALRLDAWDHVPRSAGIAAVVERIQRALRLGAGTP